VIPAGEWRWVRTPFLHRPRSWAASFNSPHLNKIIAAWRIEAVVNGSYYLYAAPMVRNFTYIVDIADAPLTGKDKGFDRLVDKRLKCEIARADAVTVSSRGLVDFAKEWYGASAHFLPNGADLATFKKVSDRDVARTRAELGFDRKWVISYIGQIGQWVDMSFLLAVFQEVRRSMPDAALLVVGGGPTWKDLQRRHQGDAAIRFTGPVPPEDVARYFLVSDLGVLPSERSTFQDMAFHIKLVEYAAARRFVVTSDLKEVQQLGFPNVRIAPLQKDPWVKALKEARAASWTPAWDRMFEAYDWKGVARTFRGLLEPKAGPRS
jgi:glycosyltransferase involved in cell wall biosynthesis